MHVPENDSQSVEIFQALDRAFHKLVRERRKTNDTLVLADKNGNPVHVNAWDIPLPEDAEKNPK